MRRKKLKLSAVLLIGLGLTGLQAQEAIPATGGNALGNGGSVSYSVGQLSCKTHTGTSGSVAEGVQQPYEISVLTAIEEAKGISLFISAYPNPTTNYLTLAINDNGKTSHDLPLMSYQLYDMNGKLLQRKKITGSQTSIAMSKLVPAPYFVKVIKANKVIKIFKIIKTQ